MNMQELIKCLSGYEKDLLLYLLKVDEQEKIKRIETIFNTNKAAIENWAYTPLSDKVVNTISRYFAQIEVELTYNHLDELSKSDLKSIRNIGEKSIKEFLQCQILTLNN
jgi:hypothetical protein